MAGGAVVTAPTAAAVGASACNTPDAQPGNLRVDTTIHLRSGPSTNYTSRGLLQKGTEIRYRCSKNTGPGAVRWHYGQVISGANNGKYGWVYYKYVTAI